MFAAFLFFLMGFQIGKKCSRGFLSLVLAGKHVWCFEERDLVLVVGFHQWEPDCSLPCTAVQPHSPPCCHPEGSNHFSFDAQVQVKPLLWQQLTQTCSASPHHCRFGSYSGLCKLMLCTQCGPLPPWGTRHPSPMPSLLQISAFLIYHPRCSSAAQAGGWTQAHGI